MVHSHCTSVMREIPVRLRGSGYSWCRVLVACSSWTMSFLKFYFIDLKIILVVQRPSSNPADPSPLLYAQGFAAFFGRLFDAG